MTNEELSVIENRMSQEEIMERAKTLRPVAEFKDKGHLLCWVDGMKIHKQSYTWLLNPLKPTGYLRELARATGRSYDDAVEILRKSIPGIDEYLKED